MKKVLLAFDDRRGAWRSLGTAHAQTPAPSPAAPPPAAPPAPAAAPAASVPITDADIKNDRRAQAGGQGQGRSGRHDHRHRRPTFPSATRRRA